MVPISGQNTCRNRRVLVVDGNLPLLALLSTLLERDEYRVETACSAKEALTIAAEFHPEVIFVCVDLPVTTGYELAKTFRTMAEHAGAWIAAMTSREYELSTEEWKLTGFDFVLPKPVNIEHLLAVLRAIEANAYETSAAKIEVS